MNSDRGDEIRKRMKAERDALSDDLDSLKTQARIKSDWRHYVRRYPWLFVGAGVAIGYLIVPAATLGAASEAASMALRSRRPDRGSKSGKSVLGTVIGAAAPLLTRLVVNRVMAQLMAPEGSQGPTGSASSAERPLRPR